MSQKLRLQILGWRSDGIVVGVHNKSAHSIMDDLQASLGSTLEVNLAKPKIVIVDARFPEAARGYSVDGFIIENWALVKPHKLEELIKNYLLPCLFTRDNNDSRITLSMSKSGMER